MNTKIQNYVDVLFKGIPNTKKAQELREEILSTLNDHFEAHIAEGKSENQAYTESLADLGDIDELLKTLEPEEDLKNKIDTYRKKRAKNTSISVMLFIFGVVCLIGFGGVSAIFGIGDVEKMGLVGLLCMLSFIGVGIGILVYTKMSRPQDVDQYITRGGAGSDVKRRASPTYKAIMAMFWPVCAVIYISISFFSGKWGVTWLFWIIAMAIRKALEAFFGPETEKED